MVAAVTYPVNYHITRSFYEKKSRFNNVLLALIERVCYVIASLFAAIYETVRNLASHIANLFASPNLRVSSLRSAITLARAVRIARTAAPESFRKLAASLSDRSDKGNDLILTRSDRETFHEALRQKGTTMEQIEREIPQLSVEELSRIWETEIQQKFLIEQEGSPVV